MAAASTTTGAATTARARRGPYAKTAKQRDAIIRAAVSYFGQYGYHGSSMREIAREVGLSQAGLLHHFATKDELLIAVLEARDELTAATFGAALTRSDDPLDALVAIVEDNATRRPLVQVFTLVSAEAADPEHPAHDYFTERTRRVIGHVRRALASAIDRGLARPDLDVDDVARQCQAMMYGLQVQWLLDPSTDMVGTFRRFLGSVTGPATSDPAG